MKKPKFALYENLILVKATFVYNFLLHECDFISLSL